MGYTPIKSVIEYFSIDNPAEFSGNNDKKTLPDVINEKMDFMENRGLVAISKDYEIEAAIRIKDPRYFNEKKRIEVFYTDNFSEEDISEKDLFLGEHVGYETVYPTAYGNISNPTKVAISRKMNYKAFKNKIGDLLAICKTGNNGHVYSIYRNELGTDSLKQAKKETIDLEPRKVA